MIYEFLARVMGAEIATVVFFLPFVLLRGDGELLVEARLTEPVTPETRTLVEHGFAYGIDYYCSVIVNDQKAYSAQIAHVLSYDGEWRVDGSAVRSEDIQTAMGTVIFTFPRIVPVEGDELSVFVKAIIRGDERFRQSTGMKTRVLWNYYVPRRREGWSFRDGRLVPP